MTMCRDAPTPQIPPADPCPTFISHEPRQNGTGYRLITHLSCGNRTDEKIRALDEQLAKYKEQLKKTRPGPAQDAIKRRALQVRKSLRQGRSK